ncbi:MAG: hypothetical protein ACR2LM_10685 [Pyrinomonadaceae bacterium]
MPIERPRHTTSVLTAIEATEAKRDSAQRLWVRMCEADNGAWFPVDFVATGAVKRLVSQSSGFRLLVESWNLLCARALLRLQIDTALRFSAIWLVEKPHDFASQIIKGQRIDRMKDRDGQQMKDAYLISRLAPAHPWLPRVYESLSGYVHFSGEHLFSPLQETEGGVEIEIHETDTKYPESSWLEVIECFNEATDIFIEYLVGWIKTKEADTKN